MPFLGFGERTEKEASRLEERWREVRKAAMYFLDIPSCTSTWELLGELNPNGKASYVTNMHLQRLSLKDVLAHLKAGDYCYIYTRLV